MRRAVRGHLQYVVFSLVEYLLELFINENVVDLALTPSIVLFEGGLFNDNGFPQLVVSSEGLKISGPGINLAMDVDIEVACDDSRLGRILLAQLMYLVYFLLIIFQGIGSSAR